MRGLGLFLGSSKRNQPLKLNDPHPVQDYGRSAIYSGDAALDGYDLLSRADPDCQGSPPRAAGTEGPVYWGPSQDFEQ